MNSQEVNVSETMCLGCDEGEVVGNEIWALVEYSLLKGFIQASVYLTNPPEISNLYLHTLYFLIYNFILYMDYIKFFDQYFLFTFHLPWYIIISRRPNIYFIH